MKSEIKHPLSDKFRELEPELTPLGIPADFPDHLDYLAERVDELAEAFGSLIDAVQAAEEASGKPVIDPGVMDAALWALAGRVIAI